ncbi:MAG: DUF962 domain-containing protein [Polyangiaceae bacterium]|nr:DUF962 domain-containing protein [Polyangiaceae bacterium]
MSTTHETREGGLLEWQLTLYPDNHSDRRNLILHVLTVPLFWAGTVAMVTAAFSAWWLAPVGLFLAVLAIALQGRGHKLESNAPVPFRGPLDVVARIFVEQWITFPRFLLSGGFARAWRR